MFRHGPRFTGLEGPGWKKCNILHIVHPESQPQDLPSEWPRNTQRHRIPLGRDIHTHVCAHTHTHTHSSSTFLQTSDLGHWQAGIVNTYVLCVQCKRYLNLKHKIDLKRVCAQSCPALCDPMDCSPQGSSVCGNFQARILERVAVSFSSGSSALRDWTRVSCVTCMAGGFFTTEPPGNVGREVNTGKDRSLVIKPTKTPRNENPCN